LAAQSDGPAIVRSLGGANTYSAGVAVDGAGRIYGAAGNAVYRWELNSGGTMVSTGSLSIQGMAVTASGLVLWSGANHTINRLTPSGVMSVLTGAENSPGYVDGPVTQARFKSPAGLAVDAAGNVFVADSGNHVIRRIAPDGMVSTVAGRAGLAGTVDGVGDTARLSSPYRIALEAAGRLYVVEQYGTAIRRVDPDGTVTTIAGNPNQAGTVDGVGTAARFSNLVSVAVTPNGDLYALESANVLRRITPAGVVTTVAGAREPSSTPVDGAGSSVRLSQPVALAAAADGTLYLSDGSQMRRVYPAGTPAPPVILTHPQSATVAVGSTLTLAVAAFGTPAPAYSWRKNGNLLAGSVGPTLTLTNLSLTDGGDFTVVLTNTEGTVTSAAARISIVPVPTNDAFEAPVSLAGTTPSSSVSFVGATRQAGEPAHQSAAVGGSVWWSWTAPSTGFVTVDASSSASGTVLGIYTGTTLATLSAVPPVPAYAATRTPSRLTFAATAGTPYQIALESAGLPAAGFARLSLGYAYVVSPVAGNSSDWNNGGGTADGTGAAARFQSALGIARDSTGNFFVTDSQANTLRKLTPSGVVTTFAGTAGNYSFANGTGAAAAFRSPQGIAIDASNNLYLADRNNHSVRKITPTGAVSLLAGGASDVNSGYVDSATPTAARFDSPMGVAVDASGNVYVADFNNHRIRRITSAGAVTTYAGSETAGSADGTGTAAQFYFPAAVALRGTTLYVTEIGEGSRLRAINLSNAAVTTVASYPDLPYNARVAAVDAANNIYLVNPGYNSQILRVSPGGTINTIVGRSSGLTEYVDGDGLQAVFRESFGLVIDPTETLWFTALNSIRRAQPTNLAVAPVLTSRPASSTVAAGKAVTLSVRAYGGPTVAYQWRKNGTAIPGANGPDLAFASVQISDSGSYEVTVSNPSGTLTPPAAVLSVVALPANDNFGAAATLPALSAAATSYNYSATREAVEPVLSAQAAGRSLWWKWTASEDGMIVADTGGSAMPTYVGAFVGASLAELRAVGIASPSASATDAARVYVSVRTGSTYYFLVDAQVNSAEGAVRFNLSYAHTATTFAGSVSTVGSTDGAAPDARFSNPHGIARDSTGNLYVADWGNRLIRKITPGGIVTTLAGSPGQTGTVDGTGAAARFSAPTNLAVDSAGNLYVSDNGAHTIRKITPAGAVTTIAGLAGTSGSTDGLGTAARFYSPRGLAIGADGALYVADSGNRTIRRIVLASAAVTTFAGAAGATGVTDGTGADARLTSPRGLAAGPDGHLYLADQGARTVRRITVPGAVVSTLAGRSGVASVIDNVGTEAGFNSPEDLAVDASGNIHVSESSGRILRRISPSGHVVTIAGLANQVSGVESGSGPLARFGTIGGVAAAPDGTVWSTEFGHHVVRRVAPSFLPQAPIISSVPTTQTVLVGTPVTFTVTANAVPAPTVVWRRNGAVIAGANDTTLILRSAQQSDAGEYVVTLTNPQGTAVTSPFTLTVTVPLPNDDLASRATLTGTHVTVAANNFLATAEPGEPAHYEASGGKSAWWSWTAPHDGPAFVQTSGSNFETMLAIYTGNALGSLVRVVDGTNLLRFEARAGTTYQIALDGKAGATGACTLSVFYAYAAQTLATGLQPRQIVRDAEGNGWFTDATNTVRRITPTGLVTIFAGSTLSDAGSSDGVGATARFAQPEGLARASDGTLYVADSQNHTIRRIAPDGAVTTIAGTAGSPGAVNGIGSTARFSVPTGVALDAAGENLYVADFSNYAIRRLVLATGEVTTLAGALGMRATSAIHNGTGTSARFYNPFALTFGTDGALYVSDSGFAAIRRVTMAGVVTTAVGTHLSSGVTDGGPSEARLQQPLGLATDPSGNLLLGDLHALRLATTSGSVATVAGNTTQSGSRDGTGSIARFATVRSAVVGPDRTGYLATSDRVLRLVPGWTPFAPTILTQPESATVYAGSPVMLRVEATGTPAALNYQWSRNGEPIPGANSASLVIANATNALAGNYTVTISNSVGPVTSSAATLTVLSRPANDSFANAIVLTGNSPAATASNIGATSEAGEPQHGGNFAGASLWWKWTAPASGAVIADTAGSSIDPVIAVYSGTLMTDLVEQGSAVPAPFTPPVYGGLPARPPAAMFTAVQGTTYWIAMDGSFGATGNLVLHLSFTYNFTTLAGLPGTSGSVNGTGSAARFRGPNATAVDAQGNLYVADLNNHTIRKVTPDGVVTTLAGAIGTSGYVNGTGTAARFNYPAGIVLGTDNNLYVADATNHAIRRVTLAGVVTTFAGPTTAASGTTDGTGTAARFNSPSALAVDSAGNLYVAESSNHAIRKITTGAVVTTVAGLKGTAGAIDANGTNARFNSPEGVAIDSAGRIYVADFRNNAVRRIAVNGDVTTLAGQLSTDPNISTNGYVDGRAAQSKLSGPNGVTALADGSILIADYYNSALRQITVDGYVLTLAGGNGDGHADGTGLGIKFYHPAQIAVDPTGRLYITDQGNHVVRRGIITNAPSAPAVTKQPEGVRVIASSTVTLESGAIGNAFPTYQWRKNGVAISGATAGTLVLTNAQPGDSGSYTLVATNNLGAATSDAAVVEILPLPANDSFVTRYRVIGDGVGLSTYNYLATAQPGEPSHGGGAAPAARSVWFTWTATTSGDVTIDTIGSLFDTRLSVYRGETLAGLTAVAGTTAEPGEKFAKVRVAVNAGDVLQIAVDGVGGAQGDFRLTIDYSWNFALYAGAFDTIGNAGTTLSTARFNFPAAMARDGTGNLYVADTENHTIRKITAAGVVSVFAGTAGTSGTATGTGAAARFNRPYGVAVDAAGNIYVADTNNHAIRKITSAGAVSNFAGLPGTSGSTDGTGTAARFNNPINLALDSAGNVYVTDYSNSLIRKITPAGAVTTFAGTLNTAGNSARYFNVPWGIAVDSSGNVYVGDRADIRKIAPDGTASYFVGDQSGSDGARDGLGSAARFFYPAQITIDASGNLYVADRSNHLIRKVSPNGEVRTLGGIAGTAGYRAGTAEVAVFAYPTAVFVDAGGFMYVGDNHIVRIGARQAATAAPFITTQPADQAVVTGGSVSFLVVAAGFPAPAYQWRKAGTPISGATSPLLTLSNITAANAASYDVVVTNASGSVTSRAAALNLATVPANDSFASAAPLSGLTASAIASPTLATAEAGEPSHAGSMAARSVWWSWTAPKYGAVVVQTAGSSVDTRLAIYTGTSLGALTLVAENDDASAGGASRVQFDAVGGTTYRIAVDTAGSGNGAVRVGLDYALVVSTFAGAAGSSSTLDGNGAAARFKSPAGMACDTAGNLYVSDAVDHVIRKITPAGDVTIFAGAAGQSGETNATGPAARFNQPYGLAVDSSGNVYVADYGNRVIRKITTAGVVTTLAGTAGASGATDGTGSAARFNLPIDVAIDAAGVLYVSDYGNHNVRKLTATGVVTTLAGSATNSGSADGTGTAARFNRPFGLAADASGNVYVADFSNHTVRKVTPAGVVTTLGGAPGSFGSSDAIGAEARLWSPSKIAIDASGRLFVTEYGNRVRQISADGLVTTVAGSGLIGSADGIAFAAAFNGPTSVVVTPAGRLFITDKGNSTVRQATPSDQLLRAQAITFAALANRTFGNPPVTLSASASSGLTVAFSVVSGPASLSGTTLTLTGVGTVTVRAIQAGDANFAAAAAVEQTFTVAAATPAITWAPPAAITYGAALTASQLNASAGVAGTFTYSPTAGAVLNAGSEQVLNVTFTPTNSANYTTATASTKITVNKATPNVTWATPAAISYGTALSATQLNAAASVPGSFVYSPGAGTVLGAGRQTLNATFTPTENSNYNAVTLAVTLAIEPVSVAPAITIQPVSQSASVAGGNVSFSVTATGVPAPTFAWFRNGAMIAGATNAVLTLTNVQAADAGTYRVTATNAAGSATSNRVTFSLTQPGNSAAHAVVGSGYIAGATVTITNTLTYSGTASSLSWSVLLPAGWSLAAAAGRVGNTGPAAGVTDVLDWAWTTIPSSPVTFTYTLNVPPTASGRPELVALVGVHNGTSLQFLAEADPLAVPPAATHSADTNQNFRIELLELTRVIELYNTRYGTARTGCYAVTATASEDGYEGAPARANSTPVSLSRYHSADTKRDGKIDLIDLTRVIELYNYRANTARTGQYKIKPGTEDGFESGP
jgi:sugar lactone lactonase YvrE